MYYNLYIVTDDLTFVGDWVCRSAQVTNVGCGNVTYASKTITYQGGYHLMYQAVYHNPTHPSSGGDSGAPIYAAFGSNFSAKGLENGGTVDVIYSKIDWIESVLGSSTCIDPACVY